MPQAIRVDDLEVLDLPQARSSDSFRNMRGNRRLRAVLAILFLVGCNSPVSAPTTSAVPSANPGTTDKSVSEVRPESDDARENASGEQPSDTEIVQADVAVMLSWVYDENIDLILESTHPKIIEGIGGRPRARAELKKAFSKMKPLKMKVESFCFPEAPTFLESNGTRFAIIPTKTIVSSNGQRLESLNYQFGIKERGAKRWKYAEGSRINNQNVRTLFPDFPANFKFPAIYRKKL